MSLRAFASDRSRNVLGQGFLALAIALLAVVLAPAPAKANLFADNGQDPRMMVERTTGPFRAIGMIETPEPVLQAAPGGMVRSTTRGTGFMISPCYALTNFHVVFGDAGGAPDARATHRAWISLGGDDAGFKYRRVKAVAVAWGDFAHDPRQDWTVLKVDGCPGADATIGWVELAPNKPKSVEHRAAMDAGFDGDFKSSQLVSQSGCKLGYAVDDFTIQHYCASRPGMSGSPIFVFDDAGAPMVVAIVSREQTPTATVFNQIRESRSNLAVPVRAAMLGQTTLDAVLKDIDHGRLQLASAN
jgi:V8-like Glu-specific endopeptidase